MLIIAKLPAVIVTTLTAGYFLFPSVTPAMTGKINKAQQDNHAPVVKIITPQNNHSLAANTQVLYEISVADQEDGESKYDEINPREVLLRVQYVKDGTAAIALTGKPASEPPALAGMLTSNCFNCHRSTGKSIGPSFYAIRKRYALTSPNISLLTKRILKGSAGVWGKTAMPTHPELTMKETREIVKWVLQVGSNPDINYYTGIDGSFRIKPSTVPKRKSAYILTAIYFDHGLNDDPSVKRLKGLDRIIIRCR
jgi:cytochrome c